MKKIKLIEIHTDGGSRGNPGPAGIGVTANVEGEEIFTVSKAIGETTNNVAEYTAVIEALNYIEANKINSEKIRFILDSELIVRQITGQYKVKLPHLQELKSQIVKKIEKLREKKFINQITFKHVKRHENKRADELVNLALDSN